MKHKKKTRRRAVELIAVLTLTAALFIAASRYALIERGYAAAGGEYMLLLLPFIYYAGKRAIRDFATDFTELYRTAPED